MPQAKRKTKPASKPTSLTLQISELSDRKRSIQKGRAKIESSMQSYQHRLDVAEAELVDAITTEMSDPSTKNRDLVSEARVAKGVIVRQYEQHNNDLRMLPEALKKIDLKLKALNAERSIMESIVIAEKLGNIDALQDAAKEALAEYAAAVCMTGNRNVNFTGIDGVVAQMNRDKSVSVLFVQKYHALEQSMGFEKL